MLQLESDCKTLISIK